MSDFATNIFPDTAEMLDLIRETREDLNTNDIVLVAFPKGDEHATMYGRRRTDVVNTLNLVPGRYPKVLAELSRPGKVSRVRVLILKNKSAYLFEYPLPTYATNAVVN